MSFLIVPSSISLPKVERIMINLSLFLLLWVSLLKFNTPPSDGLDSSWVLVLAHAFKNNWQAGVDYVFTYGPLGYFSRPIAAYYDTPLFYTFLMWNLILSGIFTSVIWIRMSQLQSIIEKLMYISLMTLIVSVYGGDSLYLLVAICCTSLIIEPPTFLLHQPKLYTGMLGAGLIILAILPLTKFSFFFLTVPAVMAISIHIYYQRSPQAGLITLSAFALIFLTVWVLCGQSLLRGCFKSILYD